MKNEIVFLVSTDVSGVIRSLNNEKYLDLLAHNLTIQMLKGSLNLYEFSKESAEQLRKNVTSPGGTTEAAMNVLNNKKFKDIIIEAVDSAHKRGLELGE